MECSAIPVPNPAIGKIDNSQTPANGRKLLGNIRLHPKKIVPTTKAHIEEVAVGVKLLPSLTRRGSQCVNMAGNLGEMKVLGRFRTERGDRHVFCALREEWVPCPRKAVGMIRR